MLAAIAEVDEAAINYDLIEAVIAHVVAAEASGGPMALLQGWAGLDDAPDEGRSKLKGPGAILVFLPGAFEIAKLQRQLEGSAVLQRALEGGRAIVLPLHGALPPAQQQKVFESYGPGCRKVVLSTNVAEVCVLPSALLPCWAAAKPCCSLLR